MREEGRKGVLTRELERLGPNELDRSQVKFFKNMVDFYQMGTWRKEALQESMILGLGLHGPCSSPLTLFFEKPSLDCKMTFVARTEKIHRTKLK